MTLRAIFLPAADRPQRSDVLRRRGATHPKTDEGVTIILKGVVARGGPRIN
jgi:hypothetical protein